MPRSKAALWARHYMDCLQIARRIMKACDWSCWTLDAEGLVSETILRIERLMPMSFEQLDEQALKRHVIQNMYTILRCERRKITSQKRGAGKVEYEENMVEELVSPELSREALAVEEAMEELQWHYPRMHYVVLSRFYLGFKEDEIAKQLNVSTRTVMRDWIFAKAWLQERIKKHF